MMMEIMPFPYGQEELKKTDAPLPTIVYNQDMKIF